jgi:hypothetical protein
MISLTLIAAMASITSAVLAAPTNIARQDVKDANIVIQFIKATSEIDIRVTDETTSESLGYACSCTLNSGAFTKLPIIADINENGFGNLTVGPDSYLIHHDTEYSGGITCMKIFDDVETLVHCTVPIPTSIEPDSTTNEVPKCFSAENPSLYETAQQILIAKRNTLPMDKRQTACQFYTNTNLVGDGDPHQNSLNKQITVSKNQGLDF